MIPQAGHRRRGASRVGKGAIFLPLIVALVCAGFAGPRWGSAYSAATGGGIHGVLHVEQRDCELTRLGQNCVAKGEFRSDDGATVRGPVRLTNPGAGIPEIGSAVRVTLQSEKSGVVYREGSHADLIWMSIFMGVSGLCWLWLAWCAGAYMISALRK